MNAKSFDLTEQDWIAAQRLLLKSTLRMRICKVAFGLMLIGWSALTAVYWSSMDWNFKALYGLIWFAFLAIIFRLSVGFPSLWRKLYRQQKSMSETRELTWSDDGYRIERATAHYDTKWRDLVGWTENADYLLMLHSDALMEALPKRHFDATEISDLRRKLTTAEVKRRGPLKLSKR